MIESEILSWIVYGFLGALSFEFSSRFLNRKTWGRSIWIGIFIVAEILINRAMDLILPYNSIALILPMAILDFFDREFHRGVGDFKISRKSNERTDFSRMESNFRAICIFHNRSGFDFESESIRRRWSFDFLSSDSTRNFGDVFEIRFEKFSA